MKKFKTLLLLVAAFLATASLAVTTACGGDDSSASSSPDSSPQTQQPAETPSYYKTIVNGKKVDLAPTGSDNFYLGATVTVNVPNAGTYVVNSTDGASFGDNETPEYYFTADAAGDYTFKVSYFDLSGEGEARITYYVYETTPALLTEAGGAVKLLANANAPLSFTPSTAGRYRIVTNTDYNFYSGGDDGVYARTYIVETTESQPTANFFVRCDNGLENFKFTYTVENADPVAVQSGENTKKLYVLENNLFSFTAATAGEYKITTENSSLAFGQYDATLGEPNYSKAETYFENGVAKSAFVFTAAANETVLFYAKSYEATGDVSFTLSAWSQENKYPTEIKLQNSDITINMQGNGSTVGTLGITGAYAFTWTATNNAVQVKIGNQTFTSGTVLLYWHETTTVTFLNTAATDTKVTISYSQSVPLTFEAYIAANETEQTIINYATRIAEDKSFTLTWEGTCSVLDGNNTPYTDGTAGIVFNGVNKNMPLLAYITATTETKISFTITELIPQETA